MFVDFTISAFKINSTQMYADCRVYNMQFRYHGYHANYILREKIETQ